MDTKVFQYVILWSPTEKQEEDGLKSKLLKEVTTVLAKDEKTVALLASKQIPDEYNDQLDQVNIAVRPF